MAIKLNNSDLTFLLSQLRLPGNIPLTPLDPQGIRDTSGIGNNIANPTWGAADQAFARLTVANYGSAQGTASPTSPTTFDFLPSTNPATVSYSVRTPGSVIYDSTPRTISNLIVNQPNDPFSTLDNPLSSPMGRLNPLTGLVNPLPSSAFFNFVGQFFDHGLDFIDKSGNGSLLIPLLPGDKLWNDPRSAGNFIAMGRTSTMGSTDTIASISSVADFPFLNPATNLSQSFTNVISTTATQTFSSGQAVLYTGDSTGGLTSGSTYYVNVIDSTHIQLFDTAANASIANVQGLTNGLIQVTGINSGTLSSISYDTKNTISPFIDLSQSYGSVASHTFFLKEYVSSSTLASKITAINPAVNVNTVNDTITSASHNLHTGEKVLYDYDRAGASMAGLEVGAYYFVNVVDQNTFKLYDSQINAAAGGTLGLVDIISTGSNSQFFYITDNAATGRLVSGSDSLTHPFGSEATWHDLKLNAANIGITLHDRDVTSVPLLRLNLDGSVYLDVNITGHYQAYIAASKATLHGASVDAIADTVIMSASHNLIDGQAVYYKNDGGSVIGGLVDGRFYFVRSTAADSIQLYDTAAHASAGGALGLINITADGTGVQNFIETTFITDTANIPSGYALLSTGHAFINDMASIAMSGGFNGNGDLLDPTILDGYYVAGDGRANENVALTAIHDIFHAEHNRVLLEIQALNTANNVTMTGEELFQAAKLVTEMEYQHMIFGEFARKLSPNIAAFAGYDVSINAAISQEFANAVYRLGHSMQGDLLQTSLANPIQVNFVGVDNNSITVNGNNFSNGQAVIYSELGHGSIAGLVDGHTYYVHIASSTGNSQQTIQFYATAQEAVTGTGSVIDITDTASASGIHSITPTFTSTSGAIALLDAFLSPNLLANDTVNANGLITGASNQVSNAIDEWVTDTLRNNLLGLPLDLATLNIARGRDTGIPTLNEARAQLYAQTGRLDLKPYESWEELGQYLLHGNDTLKAFIEAYAAQDILNAYGGDVTLIGSSGAGTWSELQILDAANYLATLESSASSAMVDDLFMQTNQGFNNIDLWIGGLAEAKVTNGLLGSTFDFVFANQMLELQNGDRFYYLARLAGTNLLTQIESQLLSDIVMRNTGATHLYSDIFSVPDRVVSIAGETDAFGHQYSWTAGSNSLHNLPSNATLNQLEHTNFSNLTTNLIYGGLLYDTITINTFDGRAIYDSTGQILSSASIGHAGYVTNLSGIQTFYGNPGDYIDARGVWNANGTGRASENIIGTATADRINGLGGNDTIWGDAGNDILDGGDDNDFIHGGTGDDIISDTNGGDLIWGDQGNDQIRAGADIDQVFGGEGNDVIWGGDGADIIDGGFGNDILFGDNGFTNTTTGIMDALGDADAMLGGDGNDILYGGGGNDILDGGDGDDILYGGTGANSLVGGAGNDKMVMNQGAIGWNNILNGDIGFDIVDYSAFVSSKTTPTTGLTIDLGNAGAAALPVAQLNVPDSYLFMEGVVGTNYNDTISDTTLARDANGNLILDALGANTGVDNVFEGGLGNDVMDGGLNALNGTGDTVTYEHAARGTIVPVTGAAIPGSNGYLGVVVNFGADQLVVGSGSSSGTAGNDTLTNFENITGSNFNDTLTGDLHTNIINGGLGNDTIDGGLGNDILNGGDGLNTLSFSSGLYTAGVNVDMLTGVASSLAAGAADGIDSFINFQTVRGTGFADTFTGATTGNTLIGGAGNDTYVVNNTGVTITEGLNAGTDTVQTTLNTFTLAANVENLTFNGTGPFTGTGNALNNTITASGSGNTLAGGAGNDTYVINNANNTITELAGGGTDTIQTTLNTYTLNSANVENLTFNGAGAFTGTGNANANTITGGAGNDTLNGGGGNDTLIGGAGNDTYVVNNTGVTITEGLNAGTDTVQTTLNTFTLAANVENLTFNGTGPFTGTGNALNNTIAGGGGDDLLNGGTGNDILIGGLGNDTYIIDSLSDSINENAGGGTDTIQTTLNTYTLNSANVENLTFNGAGAFTGTGNANANTITGGAGNDTLNGGGGNDTLIGGAGADKFNFQTLSLGSNFVTLNDFNVAQGDKINLSSSLFAGINSSNADWFAVKQDNLAIGDTNAHVFYNSLTGELYYEAANSATTLKFATLSSNPAIDYSSLTVDGIAVIPTGTPPPPPPPTPTVTVINGTAGNDTISGTAVNETINGLAGNDTINGGAGNDTIIGGLGADNLTGGAGADQFTFNAALGGGNIDRITDFLSGTDTIVLDKAIFNFTSTLEAQSSFVSGAGHAAITTDTLAHVIYDSTLRQLWYDPGAGAVIQIATLSSAVNASDILIV